MTNPTHAGPTPGHEREVAAAHGRKPEPMTTHTCGGCGGLFERHAWATTGMRNYCDVCFSVSGDDEVTAALRGALDPDAKA